MKEFKKIKGFEFAYEVNCDGLIRSIDRTIIRSDGKKKTFKSKELKPTIHSRGYLRVTLRSPEKSKDMFIHRLVAEAFIENIENKLQVNHINGIKTDNRIENLEWVTSKENINHAFKNDLISRKGIKNSQSKLTELNILSIRKLILKGETHKEIASKYGVHNSIISNINLGKIWKHI